MAKQVLIVGLGRFGMSLGRALADRGVDVLGLDVDQDRVEAAAALFAGALCLDATNEEALARASPANRDVCVCAIGDDSRDASILCTAPLRQLGARRVIARTNEPLQSRILMLVGAHEVVNPINEFGRRLADQLVYDRLVGEMPLGDDVVVVELHPPRNFIGKTLAELRLPQRFRVTVIALRRAEQNDVVVPEASEVIDPGDILVVVARKGATEKLLEQE